jgi:hypothetical protein
MDSRRTSSKSARNFHEVVLRAQELKTSASPDEITENPSLITKFGYRLSVIGHRFLAWVGRHPLAILVLPSLWFFVFYLPFWKDIDVLDELVWGFTEMNILLAPPLYCVLGRIPFWIADTVLQGSSPSILSSQHPSLAAVYFLVLCQHVGLWSSCSQYPPRSLAEAGSRSCSLRSPVFTPLLIPPDLSRQLPLVGFVSLE